MLFSPRIPPLLHCKHEFVFIIITVIAQTLVIVIASIVNTLINDKYRHRSH